MAPPTSIFPLHELPEKVQYYSVNLKPKRRKIRDFDLETCELYRLVQYSCTSMEAQQRDRLAGIEKGVTCVPFYRLFRRCGKGVKMFHVETTAWEGEHAYTGPLKQVHETPKLLLKEDERPSWSFAEFGGYFWSKR